MKTMDCAQVKDAAPELALGILPGDERSRVLAHLDDFPACNEVYGRHFARPYPARTTVQAGLAPGLLVEIEAIALRHDAAS